MFSNKVDIFTGFDNRNKIYLRSFFVFYYIDNTLIVT